jgi:glucose-6-phosphate isomerase
MAQAATSRIIAQLKARRKNQPVSDMRKAFSRDKQRFQKFSAQLDDLIVDYSKCAVDAPTMALLFKLAKAAKVFESRDAMFAGEAINFTEGRAVLHTALRAPASGRFATGGSNVMGGIHEVLGRMADFASGIRSGTIRGQDGTAIRDVVNIGIGGSDLGPAMATLALAPYHDGPRLHYVSNVDGAHLADTLKTLNPRETLFVIASKTFTTLETMANARAARGWISEALGEVAVGAHFCAVSTALDKVSAFGIDASRAFGFWDWVGGRYSLWSAIGLPLMIAVGADNFARFLDGGYAMDQHFRGAEPQENLPLLYALIGIWHRNICGYGTRAIIPYDQRLARLPAYLQQLDMESNGKRVTRDGRPSALATGPIVWGEPGTNGQHAFFQLLHQGTDVVPVEFMIAAEGHEPSMRNQHQMLMANCLAQSEALMRGRTLEEAAAQLRAMGWSASDIKRIAPHRVFPGNRPSVTIAYRMLDPFTLGRLIALYEHRVFCEAAIWNINAYDQWGVELGKELASALQPIVEGKADAVGRDSSTAGLVAHFRMCSSG